MVVFERLKQSANFNCRSRPSSGLRRNCKQPHAILQRQHATSHGPQHFDGHQRTSLLTNALRRPSKLGHVPELHVADDQSQRECLWNDERAASHHLVPQLVPAPGAVSDRAIPVSGRARGRRWRERRECCAGRCSVRADAFFLIPSNLGTE